MTGPAVWAKVTGLDALKAELEARKRVMASNWAVALRMGGLLIQREAVKLTPVEFGTLRKSASTRAQGSGFGTVVTVGFSTNYAVYVHEILRNHHPVGEAEFLKKAVLRHTEAVREVILKRLSDAGFQLGSQ